MTENKKESELKKKWKSFSNIIFDPWVLLLLILTIAFCVFSSGLENNNMKTIIFLGITLLSSLLGGIIANRWAQITELKVLVTRGNSAIRSLKLILLNINNIEKRTSEYIDNLDEANIEYKLISNNFQEVIEKCYILEEEIVSSIENWTDIIPEVANFKTQIGLISQMKVREIGLVNDVGHLRKEIESIKEKESEEIETLKTQLKLKEERLSETRETLRKAKNKIDNTALSGLTFSTGSFSSGLSTDQALTCSKCYKKHTPSGIFYDDICDSCRSLSDNFFSTYPIKK